MRFARRAHALALVLLMLCAAVSAQTLRSEADPRNQAPTVGTGGAPGGATGLFTVYDGQTLRRGEFTFSVAYSNYDRDPGNVDITEVPVSFNIGLSDYLELFFSTDAYKQVKVNSPLNLSGFQLPNAVGNSAALILGPVGAGTGIVGQSVFRPSRTAAGRGQATVAFPFIGAAGPRFVAGGQTFGTLGAQRSGDDGFFRRTFGAADRFPGIGSPLGGILPGLVLNGAGVTTGSGTTTGLTNVTIFDAPAYLPDMPFLSRNYATSSFNTMNFGAKIRFTEPDNAFGFALVPFYRYHFDRGDDASGFNQLSRGASPGGDFGDIGVIAAIDGRLSRSVNLSANLGFILNSNPKLNSGGTDFVMLDRPNELTGAIGFDFPVNRFFQPIAELRTTHYISGRTPNALENYPIDGLVGIRVFPARYFGFSAAYRRHFNQQDRGEFNDTNIPGFVFSDDPNGFIGQFFIGRRNERAPDILPNQAPVVNVTATGGEATTDGGTRITTCARDASLATPENSQVQITTQASDPDGDTLLYTYTTTGGRIVGEGPNVTLDLAGAAPGTYTVTAEVDDGCGCVSYDTTTVEVVECEPLPTPVCPTVTITNCVDSIEEGQTLTFTANTGSEADPNVTPTFNWTVTAGNIVSGQGTNSITVDTTGLGGQSITATATVSGYAVECTNVTASCTTQVIVTTREARKVSEYGDILDDEAKAQLDIYAVELNNDPTATATVVGYGGRNGRDRRRRGAQQRADFARDYLVNQRGVDASRVQTIDGGFREDAATELWLVPTGAPQPTASPTVDASEVRQTPVRRRAPRRRGRRD